MSSEAIPACTERWLVKCYGRKDGAYESIRINPDESTALQAPLLKGSTGRVQKRALFLTSDFHTPGRGEAECPCKGACFVLVAVFVTAPSTGRPTLQASHKCEVLAACGYSRSCGSFPSSNKVCSKAAGRLSARKRNVEGTSVLSLPAGTHVGSTLQTSPVRTAALR